MYYIYVNALYAFHAQRLFLFRSLLNIFLIIQIHNLFTGAPMRLQGKVAFITGAGAGIAKASAKAFVREGAKVAIIELSKKTGAQTEQEILAAGGGSFFYRN